MTVALASAHSMLCAIAAIWGLSWAVSAPAADPAARVRLSIGTEIPLVLDDALSSKTNVKGDRVHLSVAHDVFADGVLVIAAGTPAIGEVIDADTRGSIGAGGQLTVAFLYIVRNGQAIRLGGRIAARGKSDIAPALLLSWLITGKSATMAKGAAVSAYLDHDAWIDGVPKPAQ